MAVHEPQEGSERVDYFISRRGANAVTAKEVADVLIEAGYTVIVQDNDMPAGTNIVLAMHQALKRCQNLIILLTADYDASAFTIIEFTNFIMAQARAGSGRRLILLQVDDSEPDGVFAAIAYVSLRGVSDRARRREIILAAAEGRTAPELRRPKVFEGVPPRDLNFLGRDEALARLHDRFMGSETAAAITQAAVHGLGGIGKTSLAIEYAYRFGAAYQGVWWASAASVDELTRSLAELAARLDVVREPDASNERMALKGLAQLKGGEHRPWLLIYDNVDKPGTVRSFIPSNGARVLVTTRWSDWGGLAADISIDVLSPDDAVKLLLTRCDSQDEPGARRLAEKLGYLPVALDHAGAYIRLTNISFDQYALQIETRIADLPHSATYPASVAATFEIGFSKAIAECAFAENVLSYIAFLPSERIAHERLEAIATKKTNSLLPSGTQKEFEQALIALASVSLIEHHRLADGTRAVSAHRLVQAAMRNRLSAKATQNENEIVLRVSKTAPVQPAVARENITIAHPPKPRVALACGTIGPRSNRIPDGMKKRLAAELRTVLETIAEEAGAVHSRYPEFFAPDPASVCVVTALVEGGDRLAASVAVSSNFLLDVALPYSIEEFETEMSEGENRAEFHTLLRHARSILTLGNTRNPQMAHRIASETILGQSDLLLAIWDGRSSSSEGSVAWTINRAVEAAIPTIIFDANGIEPPRLVNGPAPLGTDMHFPNADILLPRVVDRLLRPPEDAGERDSLRKYFGERGGRRRRVEYSLLLALLRVRQFSFFMYNVDPGSAASQHAAMAVALAPGNDPGRNVSASQAYGWADAVGVQMSDVYRSAFVISFGCIAGLAFVIGTALLTNLPAYLTMGCAAILLAVLVVNIMHGRRQDWQRRWLEAREVADRLHAAMLLWALGIRLQSDAAEAEFAWTVWYSRAVVRDQGIRSGVMDTDGLLSARSVTLSWLENQNQYHQMAIRQATAADRRLAQVGTVVLLTATIATASFAVLSLVMDKLLGYGTLPAAPLLGVTIALLGLAFAALGIRFVGDFVGIAKRARSTSEAFSQLTQELREDQLDIAALRARAQTAADVILSEAATRGAAAIRSGRSLSLPG